MCTFPVGQGAEGYTVKAAPSPAARRRATTVTFWHVGGRGHPARTIQTQQYHLRVRDGFSDANASEQLRRESELPERLLSPGRTAGTSSTTHRPNGWTLRLCKVVGRGELGQRPWRAAAHVHHPRATRCCCSCRGRSSRVNNGRRSACHDLLPHRVTTASTGAARLERRPDADGRRAAARLAVDPAGARRPVLTGLRVEMTRDRRLRLVGLDRAGTRRPGCGRRARR